MNKLNVYLSGATKHMSNEFQNWRYKCLIRQENGFYDLNFIDPISHFNYTNKQPKTEKQCLDLFMWLVEKSDILLCNLDHSESSIGTAMEVEHASCNNIPIIAFGKKETTWYNWIVERCSVVFDDLDEAVNYISITYGSI